MSAAVAARWRATNLRAAVWALWRTGFNIARPTQHKNQRGKHDCQNNQQSNEVSAGQDVGTGHSFLSLR